MWGWGGGGRKEVGFRSLLGFGFFFFACLFCLFPCASGGGTLQQEYADGCSNVSPSDLKESQF